MTKALFWNLFRSRFTLLLILLFMVAASISYIQPSEYKASIALELEDPPDDLNIENAKNMLKKNKALHYVYYFIYVSELHDISIFLLLAYMGIFLSAKLLQDVETGYGNMMMTRTNYSAYTKSVFLGQSMYIAVLIALAYAGAFVVAWVWNGFQLGETAIGYAKMSALGAVGIVFLQITILILYLVCINGIVLHLSVGIRKKYLLQAAPLIAFGFVPMVLVDTVGKLFPLFGKVFLSFLPMYASEVLSTIFSNPDHWDIPLSLGIALFIMIATFIVLRKKNIREFSENYLP